MLNILKKEKGKSGKTLPEWNQAYAKPAKKKKCAKEGNWILSESMRMSSDEDDLPFGGNICVAGGSDAGKAFDFIGPNLLQALCSYVVVDAGGKLYKSYREYLKYKGYEVRCLDLLNMESSDHYNPFCYIHNGRDIRKLVNALMQNTTSATGEKINDFFFRKAEEALLSSVIGFLYYLALPSQQAFSYVMELLRAAVPEDNNGENVQTVLECVLEDVWDEAQIPREDHRRSFIDGQYETYKLAAGKTQKEVVESCIERLQIFDLEEVADITGTDNISLDTVWDKKTALFIILPTAEQTYNVIAAVMLSQIFQRAFDIIQYETESTCLVTDKEGRPIRCFRADDPEDLEKTRKKAEGFLKRAKKAFIIYNEEARRYELMTGSGERVAFHGEKKEMKKLLKKIRKEGRVVPCGHSLPIHTALFLDYSSGSTGSIPDLDQFIATMTHKYKMSASIIMRSFSEIKKLHRNDWIDITENCDTTIFLGGGADSETLDWVCRKAKKRVGEKYTTGGLKKLFRNLPENECFILTKEPVLYRDKKYKITDHPAWQISCGLARKE